MEKEQYHSPMVGDRAPGFSADSTLGSINFPDDLTGRWVVLLFYPHDFSPVCTSEFMGLASMQLDLRESNCDLLAVSMDSIFSHVAWIKNLHDRLSAAGQPDLRIHFPIVSDSTMAIHRQYGLLREGDGKGEYARRTTCIIDPEGVIRSISVYPITVGRSTGEIRRLLMALQYSDVHKVGTPADWDEGGEVLVPAPTTVEGADERMQNRNGDHRCMDWFLCYRPSHPHGKIT